MSTRTRMNPGRGLLVALVAGLASFGAAAVDEVVVYGADVAGAEAENARLRAELKEYLESLNRRLKEQLDEQLENQPAASIKLTLTEISGRG